TEYREAVRLKPDFAEAYCDLGVGLVAQGDSAGAIAEFREAIRLKPDFAPAHSGLGVALVAQGDTVGAIAESREAIRLKPDDALPNCRLGILLRRNGEYAEALAEYRRGHELGSKRRNWSFHSADLIREGERLVSLAPRFPAVLKGDDQPADS